MMQPQILLLKEGTDQSQGIGQLISNINACEAVTEILKTTLGPRGMDKLIHNKNAVTISNDGATIIHLLDIVHPAARTLCDIAKSQDDEVGDGTTSVVLLAGEVLRCLKPHVEDGIHPQTLIRGLREALDVTLKKLGEISVKINKMQTDEQRDMLIKCASTALNSKLIERQKEFFAEMIVTAVLKLDPDAPTKLLGIKKITGGSTTDSTLIDGVAFKKTFSYAGFEQQPKKFKNPLIVALNVELELKSERSNAEIRVESAGEYQEMVDAEWNIIYRKLQQIVDSGAQVVLSKLPIGDLATQFFADRDVFCAGRVPIDDLERITKTTGAIIQTSLNDLSRDVLGTCEDFEERQIGGERYNIFTGCPQARTATFILRGGSEQFIAETHRSIHDSICIVRRALNVNAVVGGGGAVEMELSKFLRQHARTIRSKIQLVVSAMAKALEVVPRQLAENAGFDCTDIVNELRARHAKGERWAGVDIDNEGVCDTYEKFVWEPVVIKQNAIAAAVEAACVILSVDETVRNPKAQTPTDDRPVH